MDQEIVLRRFLMSIDPRLLELLELITTAETQNKPVKTEELARELGYPLDDARKLLENALSEGLVERVGDVWRLTDKGRVEVQSHREHYIHERYGHRAGFLGRLARFVEGSIQDWRGHWRGRHGLDENSLRGFYRNIQDLEGRVEETSSLVELYPGERGTVAFALGGYGLVRRLADMGLTPGTEVTVVRNAPFRGPLEVSVRGTRLALGYGVASKVFVKRPKGAD